MFETLLMIGFFSACLSQLIPESEKPSPSRKNNKTKTERKRKERGLRSTRAPKQQADRRRQVSLSIHQETG